MAACWRSRASLPRRTFSMSAVQACSAATRHQPKTGLLMLNMGGPQNEAEVHPFLLRLFSDREIIKLPFQSFLGPWIAKRRAPSIQQKYAEIGGGSPILKWTDKQGQLLCSRMDRVSPESGPHKHYIGFRYTPPLTEEALDQMIEDGVEHAVAFSQYPQYSCATSGSSFNAIYKYLHSKPEAQKMKWSVIDRWGTNELLAKTFAALIRAELDKCVDAKARENVVLLFTAHSLPMKSVERGDPYPAEVGATVQLVMKELGFQNPYRLVWQSKVGPQPWLSPATDAAISAYVQRGRKRLMLIPIAFTSEHIETLHELDIEYAELAHKAGVDELLRCPAPNDHPLFIDALVDVLHKHLKAKRSVPTQYMLRCPMCENESCGKARLFYQKNAYQFPL